MTRSSSSSSIGISIHALREEGDRVTRCSRELTEEFLSTPSARRATCYVVAAGASLVFLSTPSARRATPLPSLRRPRTVDFYPRPPRGGRLLLRRRGLPILRISIHALREEGDNRSEAFRRSATRFLSTPSARRATTVPSSETTSVEDFYPRPPRGGRRAACASICRRGNFYPRPPRGGRHAEETRQKAEAEFLSTPSARRATGPGHDGCRVVDISIHALREEGDALRWPRVSG